MNKATMDKIAAIRQRIENAKVQRHPSNAHIEKLKARIESLIAAECIQDDPEDSTDHEEAQECNHVKGASSVRYGSGKRTLEVLSEEEALKRSSPELWEELKKRMLDTYPARIDSCVKLYEETHNPLYLWKAIGYSMTVDIPLPPAVRNYLVECANNLLGGFECKRALKLNECGNESMLERMNRRGVEIDKVTAYSNRLPGFETQERSARTLGIGARWFSKIISKHKRS